MPVYRGMMLESPVNADPTRPVGLEHNLIQVPNVDSFIKVREVLPSKLLEVSQELTSSHMGREPVHLLSILASFYKVVESLSVTPSIIDTDSALLASMKMSTILMRPLLTMTVSD